MKGARIVAVLGAVFVVLGGIYALGVNAVPAPNYRGDQLGMDNGESVQDYKARVDPSLQASSAQAWALVSFKNKLSFSQAAHILEPAGRVSAVVFSGVAARGIPEPVAGEDRADVFDREAGQLRRLGQANGVELDVVTISGAVVHESGEVLRDIANSEEVLAVEVLPADARWGSFGISPVESMY